MSLPKKLRNIAATNLHQMLHLLHYYNCLFFIANIHSSHQIELH